MSVLRVLVLSSSRVGNSAYLETAAPVIKNFLGETPVNIAFIPFAAADNNYESYLTKTKEGLAGLPYNIAVVKPENARSVIEQADVIMVGGGNTFKLLHDLYLLELTDLIREKIHAGTSYIGWSAGANIAGLTIGTTNDMPVLEPKSFKALGFFPFQINPHYINVKPEGHNGETRDERLSEYLKVNPQVSIVGLPEGTALHLEGKILTVAGQVPAVVFHLAVNKTDVIKETIAIDSDLSHLL